MTMSIITYGDATRDELLLTGGHRKSEGPDIGP